MEDSNFFADTLQMPRDLIWGLAHILQALNSGLPLDPEKFRAHCKLVKDKFYGLADWVVMWSSFHKVNHTVVE